MTAYCAWCECVNESRPVFAVTVEDGLAYCPPETRQFITAVRHASLPINCCDDCILQLRQPLVLIHRARGQDVLVPCFVRPSRLIRDPATGEGVPGLFTIGNAPKDSIALYGGLVVREDALDTLYNQRGIYVSRMWAVQAPQPRADPRRVYLILGQFAPWESARSVAHRINTRRPGHDTFPTNARWGERVLTVDDVANLELDATNYPAGTRWPCFRTTHALPPLEEVLINDYGGTYWAEGYEKEHALPNVWTATYMPPGTRATPTLGLSLAPTNIITISSSDDEDSPRRDKTY